jgi:hypothetical protein
MWAYKDVMGFGKEFGKHGPCGFLSFFMDASDIAQYGVW